MKIEFSEISMIEVEAFHKQILEDISNYKESVYTLDFLDVEILSLSAIQVLISLKKYCDLKDIELRCVNINANNIIQSLETYNLKETLGIKS